jgi:hypothetical protein
MAPNNLPKTFTNEFPALPVHKIFFKTPFCNFLHGLVWALRVLEQSPFVDQKGAITATLAMRRLRQHVDEEAIRMLAAGEMPRLEVLGEDDADAVAWLHASLMAETSEIEPESSR